jgi:hypothetical protein
MSRSNILFLIIGALVIVVAVMGYEVYQDRKQPEGMRIDVWTQRPKDRKEITRALSAAPGIIRFRRLVCPCRICSPLLFPLTVGVGRQRHAAERESQCRSVDHGAGGIRACHECM